MAIVTQEFFNAQQGRATVSVTFDNTNGEISQLSWTVQSGTLVVTVDNPPKPQITVTRTSNGSQNVPANQYFLVQDRGGNWGWTGSISYTTSWHP